MTELTPALIDKVCRRVHENGFYPDSCLVEEGVTLRRARMWLRRGEELERDALMPDPGTMDELCLSLVSGVHHAEARIENLWCLYWNEAIKASAGTGKNAAAIGWMNRLERRFPEKYKRPLDSVKRDAPVSFDALVRQRASSKTKSEDE